MDDIFALRDAVLLAEAREWEARRLEQLTREQAPFLIRCEPKPQNVPTHR
jgi:hypothetical protein